MIDLFRFSSLEHFVASGRFRAGTKPINKQTHKQNFHGTVPGLSRDCPGTLPAFSWDFLGILFMCFPFSWGKRETHKQFDPHPFPGQSREVVYVYWFFLPRKITHLLSVNCRSFKGATRLGATGLRGSEREICLWEGLWEDLWEGGFQRFSEVF